MLQSVVTKILVGPDPGLLNTCARHVWLMRSRGRMGWPCVLTQRTFTSPGNTVMTSSRPWSQLAVLLLTPYSLDPD